MLLPLHYSRCLPVWDQPITSRASDTCGVIHIFIDVMMYLVRSKQNPGMIQSVLDFAGCVTGRLKDVLTGQEVVLGIQQGGDGLHPSHLDAGGGRLQCETLRRASRPQHELAGISVHTVLHRQVSYLITHNNKTIRTSLNQPSLDP